MERLLAKLTPPPAFPVILPSAPTQLYLLDGTRQPVWHQRSEVNIHSEHEDLEGLDKMTLGLQALLEEVRALRVPKVVVGGFSMGGHTALHAVYRRGLEVEGCVALSCFLVGQSEVYRTLEDHEPGTPRPPLLQGHGLGDVVVPAVWARETHGGLEDGGVEGRLVLYEGLGHQPSEQMMRDTYRWIEDLD